MGEKRVVHTDFLHVSIFWVGKWKKEAHRSIYRSRFCACYHSADYQRFLFNRLEVFWKACFFYYWMHIFFQLWPFFCPHVDTIFDPLEATKHPFAILHHFDVQFGLQLLQYATSIFWPWTYGILGTQNPEISNLGLGFCDLGFGILNFGPFLIAILGSKKGWNGCQDILIFADAALQFANFGTRWCHPHAVGVYILVYGCQTWIWMLNQK